MRRPTTGLAGLLFFLSLAAGLGCRRLPPPPTAAADLPPRLTVVVVVDQMRGDELDTYAALWRGGLGRLRQEGQIWRRAEHGHARSETAAGHATIATGVLPRVHGVVNKSMYTRERGRVTDMCDWGSGPCAPVALAVPSLSDRHRARWPAAKIVALSQKPRAASLMGGQQADLVAWHAPAAMALEGWQGGQPGLPDWLQIFFGQAVRRDTMARIWELPRLPEPFASRPDRAAGELDCGHGLVFPHQLSAVAQGAALMAQWACTPDSDRAVAETALTVARQLGLGQGTAPDLLWLSFAAVDVVGHHYGIESLERPAVLTELDLQLGDLMDGLQALVGPRLLLVLTADHGVAPKVAAARAAGEDSGWVDPAGLVAAVEAALTPMFGPGPHVAALDFPFLSLTDAAGSRRPAAVRAAAAVLGRQAHVHRAWVTAELAVATTHEPLARLMQASLYPGRSGDVALVLQPFYSPGSGASALGGANHGSPWSYDRHVPLMLWGDRVSPGSSDAEVGVIDLMRTVADRLLLPVDPRGGQPLPRP